VNKVKVADSAASFALIEAGRAGAFIGNTSSMVKAKAVREDVVAIPMDDGMPGQVYVAREEDISANADKYVAFLKATHRSALEIATAKDLQPIIKTIVSKYTMPGLNDMKTAEINLSENAQNWIAKGNDNLLRNIPEVWAAAVPTLHDAGMIKSAPDPKTLYTNDLLDKAVR
jgi:ABC-type nitrate/sulfonate/bicarbonate transport system substrate-binding protein